MAGCVATGPEIARGVIPTALEDDLIFKGGWYRAWGWWGGHAPKERLTPTVIIYDRWCKSATGSDRRIGAALNTL
jgi:hypothetical protein